MTNKAQHENAHEFTSKLILDLFDEKGVFHLLRNGAVISEVEEFSKQDAIIKLTENYLNEVKQLWENRQNKDLVLPDKFPDLNDIGNQFLDKDQSDQDALLNVQNSKPAQLQVATNESSEQSSEIKHNQNKENSLDIKMPKIFDNKPGAIPSGAIPATIPIPKISFSLKNAKVSEDYSAELQVQGETEQKRIVIKEISFPDGLGLSALSPDFRKIIGLPLVDGDFKISVTYQFQDANDEYSSITNLFINPDPKSLWKILEPDADLPYKKKHEDTDLIAGGGDALMISASRRGRSHEHGGTFRDDDFLLRFEQGWDIIAVADGAGGSKSSRKGSELAVYNSVKYLSNALASHSVQIEKEVERWFVNQVASKHDVKAALYETFGRAAYAAVKAIEEEAATNNANVKDYSTTLLLAGHKKLPFGHLFAAYWVGDGAVGVYEKGKKIQLLGEVDSGEFAGQTRFLDKQVMNADDVMSRLRFTVTDDFTSLILMTDGVTDPKFETDNNLSKLQKWDDLWVEIEPMLIDKKTSAAELLKWLEFWSPGNHDDRTIALLYK